MNHLRIKIFTVLLLGATLMVAAGIKVHKTSGKATVIRKGNVTLLKTGDALTPADMVEIPAGSTLEVINDVSGSIYTSTRNGKMTISRLMLDAKERASDNIGTVNRQLRFGEKSGKGDNRVYVETGMVKRSLAEYDPEAANREIDIPTLSGHVRAVAEGRRESAQIPLRIEHGSCDTIGMRFRLVNTLDFPIYFNVVKLNGCDKYEISELGQPTGSYVIQPHQSIIREHFPQLPDGERHIMIAAHCHYDIDRLLEQLNSCCTSGENGPEIELPVYVNTL